MRPNQRGQEEPANVEGWPLRGSPVSTRLPQQVLAGRRRLLAALAHLQGGQAGNLESDESPFAAVQVDRERCSACDLCARFCPTGALQFNLQYNTFTLSFQTAACVDCGVCTAACPEDAVTTSKSIALSAILAEDVTAMADGELVRCTSCGALTAHAGGESLARCHVCRRGAGVVTSLRDDAGLMDDLLRRIRL
jgi:ferredoxin